MTKVPEFNLPKPPQRDRTIYCFPPGTSEADKQHDIAAVNEFVEHIKAKRRKKR